LALFPKGMQRYNFLRYSLQLADDFLCFLSRNRIESSEGLSVPFDFLLKNRLRSYPYAAVSVHGLIYDHVFQGFRMLCNMEYLIDIPFEVSVILACHIQLFDHMLHLVAEEVLVINISEAEFNI